MSPRPTSAEYAGMLNWRGASKPPPRRPRRARPRHVRPDSRPAARRSRAEAGAHRARASGNRVRLPARHGQNDPAIALGRRNWTFAGSDEGVCRASVVYTPIETAKLNGIDPRAWLASVLARLLTHSRATSSTRSPAGWVRPRTPPSRSDGLIRGLIDRILLRPETGARSIRLAIDIRASWPAS